MRRGGAAIPGGLKSPGRAVRRGGANRPENGKFFE